MLEQRHETETRLALRRPVEWAVSGAPVAYPAAVARMEHRVQRIAAGEAAELIWLLQHPPIYTAGTSARPEHLIEPQRFPVHRTGRGGQYTYHGPGQRVVYVMLDVMRHADGVRAFVAELQSWAIATLGCFNVRGELRPDRVGVWVARPDKGPGREDKIAAVGVRIRRSISFHGLSINVDPDLGHYSGIVPCGVIQHGMTSLADLGLAVRMEELDAALEERFRARFAPTVRTEPPCPVPPAVDDAAIK